MFALGLSGVLQQGLLPPKTFISSFLRRFNSYLFRAPLAHEADLELCNPWARPL